MITNVKGVAVSEFNINDDHKGDLVLDFKANCVSGCDNNTNSTINSTADTFQQNDATLENNIILTANSGSNTTSKNKDGNSIIETGNAYVSANALNFVNNNISGTGKLIVAVVNLFGKWDGNFTTNPTSTPTPTFAPTPTVTPALSPTPTPVSTVNFSTSLSQPTPTPQPEVVSSISFRQTFTPLIAGIQIKNNKPPKILGNVIGFNPKKRISVNLAWLLLTLPITGSIVLRKIFPFFRNK